MRRNFFDRYFGVSSMQLLHRPLPLAFIVILLGAIFIGLLSSCKQQKKEVAVVKNSDVYYTCSMHPQVHEEHPGNCPICGMKLIAVPKTSTTETAQMQLSEQQMQLGNIQVDTIGKSLINDKLVLVGTLNFNEDKLSSVSARVEGRIQKLYFKNVGDYVHKGDKIFDLYSEQLNNAKQEYINAVEQQNSMGNSLINYSALVQSAKNKLVLWGLTNEQIDQLVKNKNALSLTTFYSTEEGYITSLSINEGDYVMEGGTVMQLANLSTLWAEAEVYATQMFAIKQNEKVSVQVPGLNKTIDGTINFINPEINPDARINLVRAVIPNNNNLLHPGMPVYITINKQKLNTLTLPIDAVLTDGKSSSVWVQTKPATYEVRMVQTGITNGNAIEIISGINNGDVVVTSGAYLLNSEYIFEHGTNAMAGMKM